ncbi:MAG TPA: hypothetical protein VFU15_01745, partial [Bacteroidia bacterium]|nr:hypothetical protein [Bacteroidia bacterium]
MLLILLLSFLGFFGVLFTWVLLAPVRLDIDTTKNLYSFRVIPFFRLQWMTEPVPGHAEMYIFGVRKKLSVHTQEERKTVKPEKKAKRRS